MFSLIYSPGTATQVEAATSTSVEAPVAPQPEMNTEGLIGDLALILVFGAVFTLLFKKLKQPVVLGYIVAGFFVGPHFLYCPSVTNEANIDFWAQIGIIVLLFSLGLEFNFKKLLNVGGSAAITAVMRKSGLSGLHKYCLIANCILLMTRALLQQVLFQQ